MKDGSFVTSVAIREVADRLHEALKAVSEGNFKPYREKDELTYTLGIPEHTGRIRGMGIVPWKHDFNVDLDTYRSRARKKAEQEEKMRALEERVASIEGAIAASQQQRRSSIASTEHPAADRAETVAEHYPVDDITMMTHATFYIS